MLLLPLEKRLKDGFKQLGIPFGRRISPEETQSEYFGSLGDEAELYVGAKIDIIASAKSDFNNDSIIWSRDLSYDSLSVRYTADYSVIPSFLLSKTERRQELERKRSIRDSLLRLRYGDAIRRGLIEEEGVTFNVNKSQQYHVELSCTLMKNKKKDFICSIFLSYRDGDCYSIDNTTGDRTLDNELFVKVVEVLSHSSVQRPGKKLQDIVTLDNRIVSVEQAADAITGLYVP